MQRFAIFVTLLLAAPAAAEPCGEWLAPSDHETLDAVETLTTSLRTKVVYVGRGETPETWTRKLTLWTYPAWVLDRAAFAEHAARIRQGIVADCPNATASELRLFDWSELAAAEYAVVCPLYPVTGRQDIYFVRTIAGATGLLAAAVTFPQPPTEAEISQARAWLDSLILCTPASAEPACRL